MKEIRRHLKSTCHQVTNTAAVVDDEPPKSAGKTEMLQDGLKQVKMGRDRCKETDGKTNDTAPPSRSSGQRLSTAEATVIVVVVVVALL